MMNSSEIMATYEAMAELTAQMLAAASKSDWEQLIVLEQRCAVHVQNLRQNEPAQVLEEPSRLKKVQLLKQLLDDDRRIRDLTSPWMNKLSVLLNSSGTKRRVDQAYRSV
jgi:flagellar protein FliT